MEDTQSQLKPEQLARKHIDKHLESAGWNLLKKGTKVPDKGNYALPELEINGKFADYALYVDGKPLAIVEAKKEGESLKGALARAVRCANSLKVNYSYAANIKLDQRGNTIIDLMFSEVRVGYSKSRELCFFQTPRWLSHLETVAKKNQLLQKSLNRTENKNKKDIL